jgi:hypothetical protein
MKQNLYCMMSCNTIPSTARIGKGGFGFGSDGGGGAGGGVGGVRQ